MKSCAAAVAVALVGWNAAALGAPADSVFTCTDARGKVTATTQQEMPDCKGVQKVKPPGAPESIVPRQLTPKEQVDLETRERQAAIAAAAAAALDADNRSLVSKYPDEAAHLKARETALAQPLAAVTASTRRIDDLTVKRKSLLAEAEFYPKPVTLPADLRAKLEDNEVRIAAQKKMISVNRQEALDVDKRFDIELARLKPLWAAQPKP